MIAEQVFEYREIIAECFDQDADLLKFWHLQSGKGLNKCVDATYDDMHTAGVEFFVVRDGAQMIGYFGREKTLGSEFLTGFFIIPEFRKKDFVAKFWDLVLSKFGDPFFCGLFQKNIPAISFILKNNGIPVSTTVAHGEPARIFKITKDKKCQ